MIRAGALALLLAAAPAVAQQAGAPAAMPAYAHADGQWQPVYDQGAIHIAIDGASLQANGASRMFRARSTVDGQPNGLLYVTTIANCTARTLAATDYDVVLAGKLLKHLDLTGDAAAAKPVADDPEGSATLAAVCKGPAPGAH